MYQPTTRLLTVLEILQSRDLVSGRELAERLEVDRRSVRRYVMSLQDLGIPIEGRHGPGGGYRLGVGHRLSPLILTDDQAVAVALGLLGLRRAGPVVGGGAVETALERLGRVLPPALRQRIDALDRAIRVEPPKPDGRPDGVLVAALAAAVDARRRVWIRYRSADDRETERELEPYGLAVVLGHWYVVGFCRLRRGLRSFRIDRVAAFEDRTAVFERPPEFDALAFVTRGIATMPAPHVATVRFDASLETLSARMPAAYARIEPDGGGTLAHSPIDDLDAHARYLVGLGLPFRVVAPTELREAVRRLAAELTRAAEGLD